MKVPFRKSAPQTSSTTEVITPEAAASVAPARDTISMESEGVPQAQIDRERADAAAKAEQDELPPLPPTVNPRNAVIANLAKKAAVFEGNDGAVPLNEEESPDQVESREAAAAIAAAQANKLAEEETPDDPPAVNHPTEITPPAETPPGTPPKVFKTIIKGQEVEVNEDQVIEAGLEAIRHRGAAQQALREASEILAAAKKYEAPADRTPAVPERDSPAAPEADAKELAQAIQVGSLDDAARAVAALLNRGADQKEISNLVAQTVETQIRNTLDQDKAAAALEKLVPEILSDQRVVVLLANEERAARAAGDMRPYSQLYPEIGGKVRAWLDGLKGPGAGKPPGLPTDTLQTRVAAKVATPAPITGQAARPAGTPQTKVPTGSEIIAKMRAARGQTNRI